MALYAPAIGTLSNPIWKAVNFLALFWHFFSHHISSKKNLPIDFSWSESLISEVFSTSLLLRVTPGKTNYVILLAEINDPAMTLPTTTTPRRTPPTNPPTTPRTPSTPATVIPPLVAGSSCLTLPSDAPLSWLLTTANPSVASCLATLPSPCEARWPKIVQASLGIRGKRVLVATTVFQRSAELLCQKGAQCLLRGRYEADPYGPQHGGLLPPTTGLRLSAHAEGASIANVLKH